MKKIKKYPSLVLVFMILFLHTSVLAQKNNEIQATISISKVSKGISIDAIVKSNSNTKIDNLVYKFSCTKKSRNHNFSKNKQSGVFSIRSNERLVLSKQVINTNRGSNMTIQLNILQNNKIIASDFVTYTDAYQLKKTTSNEKSPVEVGKGIKKITFSQQGRDFCDFFNQINKQRKASYPTVVEIIEKVKEGTSLVEIFIVVNDDIIYQFKTLEKPKYLYAAAQESNKRLTSYFSDAIAYSF